MFGPKEKHSADLAAAPPQEHQGGAPGVVQLPHLPTEPPRGIRGKGMGGASASIDCGTTGKKSATPDGKRPVVTLHALNTYTRHRRQNPMVRRQMTALCGLRRDKEILEFARSRMRDMFAKYRASEMSPSISSSLSSAKSDSLSISSSADSSLSTPPRKPRLLPKRTELQKVELHPEDANSERDGIGLPCEEETAEWAIKEIREAKQYNPNVAHAHGDANAALSSGDSTDNSKENENVFRLTEEAVPSNVPSLCSPQLFREDTNIQVRDVVERVDELSQSDGDVKSELEELRSEIRLHTASAAKSTTSSTSEGSDKTPHNRKPIWPSLLDIKRLKSGGFSYKTMPDEIGDDDISIKWEKNKGITVEKNRRKTASRCKVQPIIVPSHTTVDCPLCELYYNDMYSESLGAARPGDCCSWGNRLASSRIKDASPETTVLRYSTSQHKPQFSWKDPADVAPPSTTDTAPRFANTTIIRAEHTDSTASEDTDTKPDPESNLVTKSSGEKTRTDKILDIASLSIPIMPTNSQRRHAAYSHQFVSPVGKVAGCVSPAGNVACSDVSAASREAADTPEQAIAPTITQPPIRLSYTQAANPAIPNTGATSRHQPATSCTAAASIS